jgi:hypothetical protein
LNTPEMENLRSPKSAWSESSRSTLLSLMADLDAHGYDFVSVTPSTHRRVIARPDRQTSKNLRDVLGWSLPVAKGILPGTIEAALVDAGALVDGPEGDLKPLLRLSRVESRLFWHSAYPTEATDSVFLGPDSYRFAQFIKRNLSQNHRTILDYGAGAGVGGIVAATELQGSPLTIADINPRALHLAAINAQYAGVAHREVEVSTPAELTQRFDLIVTHPPFMIDADHRAYRDGGAMYGAALSQDWVLAGMKLLRGGGRLIMHTGVSMVEGRDPLFEQLRDRLTDDEFSLSYAELDPDIFGDELDQPAYADVERIAAIGLVLQRSPAA